MRDFLTLSRTFALILGLGLVALAARNVTDPDFWWHLKTGQLMAQDHRIFYTDPFSSTRNGHPWINHEWLPDLLTFFIYRVSGFSGLIVTFALVIAAGFMVLYWRSPGKPYAAGICTLLGALTALPSWGVRPQMLAFLLASLLLLLLEKSESRAHLVWWAAPLMLVWINVHGSFPVGIALIAFFALGEALEALATSTWEHARLRLAQLGAVLVVSLFLVPLNPYGMRLFWYPFQTLSSEAMREFISEWASPDFHRSDYFYLLLMLLGLLAAGALSSSRVRLRDMVLLIPAIFGALAAARHIYFFVLIAVPVLSRYVAASFRNLSAEASAYRPVRAKLNALLLLAVGIFVLLRVWHVSKVQAEAEKTHFPQALVQFLSRNPPPTAALNYYNWGGYMIWKLHPQYRVFIDGRADLYGDDFMKQYAHAYYFSDEWAQILDSNGVHTVILPPDAPLATGLKTLRGWRVLYSDTQSQVLSHPDR